MLPAMKYLLILCLTSNVAVGETWHVPKECESIQAAICKSMAMRFLWLPVFGKKRFIS